MLVFFLILFPAAWAASHPRRPLTQNVETISQVKQREQASQRAFDIFFWTLLIGFAIVIILGYVLEAPVA